MRRLALLLMTVLALVPLACGGADDGGSAAPEATQPSPEAPIVQAATRTAKSSSARFSFTASMSGGALTGSWSGEGAFASERGRMTLDFSGLGTGAGVFASSKTEVILDGLVAYLNVPPSLAQVLPEGKAWIKIDLAKLGEAQGVDLAQLMQFNQANPNGVLGYLHGATADFETVGEEKVRGVATTHYRGTIDLRKVAAQGSSETRKSYEQIIEISGTNRIPMEVWIDGDGLARRVKYAQPLGSGQGKLTLAMDLYDFGVEVNVKTPSEDQTLDLMELIGGAQ
jgi:LppX_LprAFG lipoprotein